MPKTNTLLDRIMDDAPIPRESLLVKQMSIVALVRMNATMYGTAVKQSIGLHPAATSLDLAARWAIRELTGETLPDPVPRRYPDGVWFLEPLEAAPANQAQ
jgi:hypothetical protein